MIKENLAWVTLGLVITLAGAMSICSDNLTFEAEAANGQVVEQAENTENETKE